MQLPNVTSDQSKQNTYVTACLSNEISVSNEIAGFKKQVLVVILEQRTSLPASRLVLSEPTHGFARPQRLAITKGAEMGKLIKHVYPENAQSHHASH